MSDDEHIEPTTLLDLPRELLTMIIKFLPITSLGVANTCKSLLAAGMSEDVGIELFARFYPDFDASHLKQEHKCMATFKRIHLSWFPCKLCRNGLTLPDGYRCPCVARRFAPNFRLRVGALGPARAGTSSLSSGGFSALLDLLQDEYNCGRDLLRVAPDAQLARLDSASLASLDVLILCTTEGPALDADEQATLRAWVARGGALLVSAFSNWSAFEHYAADTVRWLGLETEPHARFLPRLTHTLEPTTPVDDDTRGPLLNGPYGAVQRLRNVGESLFHIRPEAFERGGVSLVTTSGRRNLLHDGLGLWMYYPPARPGRASVAGKGRVLVCSNYHWVADSDHWNGGLLNAPRYGTSPSDPVPDHDNKALLLNFVASAVAARAGRVGPALEEAAASVELS